MPQSRTMRTLIVEDKSEDIQFLQAALQKSGFMLELSTVPSSGEALSYLRKEGRYVEMHRPDLILVDLQLPDGSGLAFLNTLKANPAFSLIPIVVLAALPQEESIREAYRNGAAGYLVKPTNANDFVSAIHKLTQYWFGAVKLPENLD